MTKSKPEGEMKTYILNMRDGSRQKLTIPAHWTLTFGSLLPFNKNSPNVPTEGAKPALRIYEGEAQRAVFTGVDSFRDSSIDIQVEVTRAQDHGAKVSTPAGEKHVIMRAEVKEWVNPDDPQASAQDLKLLRLTNSEREMTESLTTATETRGAKR